MIYLDNGATTLRKPPAVSYRVKYAIEHYSSVGRGGHSAAMAAAKMVHTCREEIGKLFHAQAEQVVFTMNATHGLNIAISSLCKAGMPVVISGYEHNAVLRPLHAIGAQIIVAGKDLFSPATAVGEFRQALDNGAELAVCTCCSNVFGYVLPYQEIADLCKSRGVPLILDASQGAGNLPVYLEESGAAFIAFPGHKGLYGPQGTGVLLCGREGKPLLHGGTGSNSLEMTMPQELPDRHEAGTHNVCGIAGLLAGVNYVRKRGTEQILARERSLLAQLINGLGKYAGVELYTGEGQSSVLSLNLRGRDCQEISQILGEHEVAVRGGLHCAPLAHKSAGTLPSGTLRISLSDLNTAEEVCKFLSLWKKLF